MNRMWSVIERDKLWLIFYLEEEVFRKRIIFNSLWYLGDRKVGV